MPQIKTHTSIVLLLFLCIPIMLMGQQFDAERIFLTTEKNHYDPGDLITVHGLLSAANQSNR